MEQTCYRKPISLYIEPPPVTDLPEQERRPVAVFCIEAALYQLQHGRHFVLVHPVDSTPWTVPQAKILCGNSVSLGRLVVCSRVSVTSNFARGQLDPLLCRHRAVKRMSYKPFHLTRTKFIHDLVNIATVILGESSIGSHFSVLIDFWIPYRKKSCPF